MKNTVKSIDIKRLKPHPDNPNRMSKENFRKLKRHIERSGRYEPIIIRPKTRNLRPETTRNAIRGLVRRSLGEGGTQYEIINGHHRVEVLKQLGYEKCDCVVWDVDDDETRLLLATLNRLSGSDILEKKTALLEKLNAKYSVKELSKLLPNTKPQIQRLIELNKNKLDIQISQQKTELPNAIVFFLNNEQKQIVEQAIEQASSIEYPESRPTKAQCNADAITRISQEYIKHQNTKAQKLLIGE